MALPAVNSLLRSILDRSFPKALLLMVMVTPLVIYFMTQQTALIYVTGKTPQESLKLTVSRFWQNLNFGVMETLGVQTSNSTSDETDDISLLQCVFPHVNPYDKEVMKMSGLKKKTLTCVGHSPDLTYLAGAKLVVNKTKVKEFYGEDNVICKYQEIFRKNHDDLKAYFGNWSVSFEEEMELPNTTEFIRVICYNSSGKNISNTYHDIIPRRKEFDELYSILLKKRDNLSSPKESLSVIMIGFDGVSRYHFLRSMPKTYRFLMNDLGSFDMAMHTQMGKDTFENYLGILTGESYQNTKRWWDFSKFIDAFDLIWQSFEKAGYRTLYTEDNPTGTGFHYKKKGFMLRPTFYCSRPITLAIRYDPEIFKASYHCVGNEPELVFHTNYVKRFFDAFPDSPLFSFTFLTKLTHDEMSNLKMVDDHLLNIYKEYQSLGHLNRTLLITFSDHGPRTGSIRSSFNGMVESRTPYAIFTLPKWFLEKYPDVANNLQTNTGRLTTHFDTHATLQDLMYFKSTGEIPLKPSKHGISLFREIPKNRTCEDIPIPPEFCLCNQKAMETIDVNSHLAKTLADKVMVSLSSKINTTLCSNLKIDKILQVTLTKLTKVLSKESKAKQLFKVRVQTVPGNGIFEATVFVQTDKGKLVNSTVKASSVDVGEVIERMNMYRGQAECVKDANQRLYCYCKVPFEKEDE